MSIQSGIGQRLLVNQYDLSGDVGSLSTFQASRNQQDVTVLLDTAMRRLPLLKDGTVTFAAFFDAAAGASQPVLSALPQSGLVSWLLSPTLGGVAGSMVANATTFAPDRGQDGALVLNTTAVANATGVQWGNLLTAGVETIASSASGTAIDDYVPVFGTLPLPSVLGLSAYLHVVSIGSGTATVHIQDSADNVSFADVTGAAFTDVTAAGSQRIATGATQAVRRYLRVNFSNTFTALKCAVVVVRNVTEYQA